MCSWNGVSCTNGHVASLYLYDNQLTGTLPPQWSTMTSMEELFLGGNQLTGTLPPQWSAMTSLGDLYLHGNRLTGTLPPQWSAMTSLYWLHLHDNQLTGTLPPQWSAMTSMDDLILRSNELTGTLPPQWSAMASMYRLWLWNNQLTGTLPPQWSAMTSLDELWLSDNQLTGTLPPQWIAMASMYRLYLHDNKLTGTLPPQWSTMTSLDILWLYSNKLTGTLPPQWSAMRSLDILYLYNNELTGTLPPQWSAMTSMDELYLHNNYLVNGVPSGIRGTVEYSPQYGPPSAVGVVVASAVVAGAAVAGYILYRRRRVALRPVAPSDAYGGNARANAVFPSSGTRKPRPRVEGDAESLIRHHSGETVATSDPMTRQQAQRAATNNAVFASALFSGTAAQVPAAPDSALASTPLQQATTIGGQRRSNEGNAVALPRTGGEQGLNGYEAVRADESAVPNARTAVEGSGHQHGRNHSLRELTGNQLRSSMGSLLGAGGFGSVYAGQLDGAKVAIKVLQAGASMQGLEEYVAEVQILAALRHPCVVQIYAKCDEERALVMELMEGGTLQDRLDDDSLPWFDRVRVLQEVAVGLWFLHNQAQPVLHRDIKPSNVLLTSDLRGKLSDMGLAKCLDGGATRLTSESVLRGTFHYLCPDYQSLGHYRAACDVFAMGVTIAVTVTNETPAGIGHALMVAKEDGQLEDLVDKRPGAQGWKTNVALKLMNLAMKCMKPRMDNRPSMEQVVQELSDLKESAAVLAPSASRTRDTMQRLLECPISFEVMEDPVVAEDGFTYEREAIESHICIRQSSPMTNLPMGLRLTPNHALKSVLAMYKEMGGGER